jgi:hypothetical protein
VGDAFGGDCPAVGCFDLGHLPNAGQKANRLINLVNLVPYSSLEQEFIEPFKENYHVVGTPTLLILLAGQEKARLLGLGDQKTIRDFVSEFLK